MNTLTEAVVELAALDWLSNLGWQVAHGPEIAPDTSAAERDDYGQVVLERRLRDALADLNPDLPTDALDDAYRKMTRPEGSTREARNREFHRMLVNGVEIEYREVGGAVRGDLVRVIDFDYPAGNDFLAVNQFTESPRTRNTRRPDVVLFVNGLPLRRHRVEEPRRRGRHHLDGVAAAPDVQVRAALSLRHERGADGLGRQRGPAGHADLRQGVVQALAHRHRRDAGES